VSLNSINKFLTNNILWILFSFVTLVLYLSPLFHNTFYVPTFDNLDSNVVWYKILAESGKIFAENNATIPNMMSGLSRLSYPKEFDAILWLYYFFKPQTAYIINEITIHLVAFFSMYIFLKKYIVNSSHYSLVPVLIGALYYSLIPYWSGAGITIAILPLVTFTLLNIKNNNYTKWDWLLLFLLPLYTSFIFFYMFYIIIAGIYLIWDTLKHHKLNKRLFFALFLMGTTFLLSEYRLVLAMFIDSGFISHRSEFNIFFSQTLLEAYRAAHTFFLNGHLSHISGLQMPYILPLISIALLLTVIKYKLNQNISMFIWIIILLSFIFNIWNNLFTNLYTLPFLTIYLLILYLFTENKYKIYIFLFLLQITLALVATSFQYEGFKDITTIFPIFKALNITRIAFIQPFIWGILLSISVTIYIKKLHYSFIFIVIFIIFQIIHSFNYSFYSSIPKFKYASFQNYYAEKLFDRVKKAIPEDIHTIKVIAYGLEPAVLLYNGFQTVDGYSTNYPLSYKHQFRNVISNYLDTNKTVSKAAKHIYDDWGSKVYLLETTVGKENYINKNITIKNPLFNTTALCKLKTDYLISSYKFKTPQSHHLMFIQYFKGEKDSWDIYLYRLNCQE